MTTPLSHRGARASPALNVRWIEFADPLRAELAFIHSRRVPLGLEQVVDR